MFGGPIGSNFSEERKAAVEWMQHDPNEPCFRELVTDFDIPAVMHEALAELLVGAHLDITDYDERPADTLDKMDKPLFEVIRLIENERNYRRLFFKLAEGCDDPVHLQRLDDDLAALPEWLRRVQAAAAKAHRGLKRSGKSPEKRDLHKLTEMLAHFWVTATGKPFQQDHTKAGWARGKGGIEEPVTLSSLFVFRFIEHIAPGRGKELRGILRVFVSKAPGNRRGRPKRDDLQR